MFASDCCDDHDRLLTLAEALERALALIEALPEIESVNLQDADGRVLAADLPARLDVPPDGIGSPSPSADTLMANLEAPMPADWSKEKLIETLNKIRAAK